MLDNIELIIEISVQKNKKYRDTHTDELAEKRKTNKEKIAERDKAYYEKNKDKILASYVCDVCGSTSLIKHKARHEQSKKHQTVLNQV